VPFIVVSCGGQTDDEAATDSASTDVGATDDTGDTGPIDAVVADPYTP